MGQVHLYYSGGRVNAPAMKKIIEVALMEEFHWTYDEIQSMPYKRLQELFVIRTQKQSTRETQRNIEQFKKEQSSFSGGQGKRTYREL